MSINRSIQAGVNQGSDYTESTSVGYLVNWTLTQDLSVGANFGYVHGTESQQANFDDSSLEFATDYDTYSAGISARYLITQRATASLGYNHNRSVSSGASRNFFVNRLSLTVAYQF